MATLHLFREFLPRKHCTSLKKILREVRRAAGEARDLDVLEQHLRCTSGNFDSKWEQLLAEYVRRQRQRAQPLLVNTHARLTGLSLKSTNLYTKTVEIVLSKIRWRGKGKQPCFEQLARRSMHQVLRRIRKAAQADFSDLEQIHAFRIHVKKLRYIMELLSGAFDSRFRGHYYPLVEKLQEPLGKLNDHASFAARLASWRADDKGDPLFNAAIEERINAELQAAEDSKAEFFSLWSARYEQHLFAGLKKYTTKGK